MQSDSSERGNIKIPEKKTESHDWENFGKNKERQLERKESSIEQIVQEENIESELLREINLSQSLDGNTVSVEDKKKKINFIDKKDKINILIKIAKEKGIDAAVKAAKEMNDPYILDTLHDILAKDEYYKNFIK